MNDGDVEKMAAELFDILAMTVKDDALTIIQVDHELQRIQAWRRMVAGHAHR